MPGISRGYGRAKPNSIRLSTDDCQGRYRVKAKDICQPDIIKTGRFGSLGDINDVIQCIVRAISANHRSNSHYSLPD
jgi:hypothetical protein